MQESKLKEIKDGYYKVCVDIEHKYFNDDDDEIDFNKLPMRFTKNKIIGEYQLKDKYDYFAHTSYDGHIKDGKNIKLRFKIEHKLDLDSTGVKEKEFYYFLCRTRYVTDIHTITRDISCKKMKVLD